MADTIPEPKGRMSQEALNRCNCLRFLREKDWREGVFALSPDVPRRQGTLAPSNPANKTG